MLYNALPVGKNHNIAPSPWDFIILPEEDRATDVGNIHENFGRDRAFDFGDILADRQTHRHAHHNTSQPLPQAK